MRTARKVEYIIIGIAIFLLFLFFTNNIEYTNKGIIFNFNFTTTTILGVNWILFAVVMTGALFFITILYWVIKE
jgi:hypothetical protein